MPVPASGVVLVRQHIAPICIEHRAYATGFAEWFEDAEHYGHEGVGEIVEKRPPDQSPPIMPPSTGMTAPVTY